MRIPGGMAGVWLKSSKGNQPFEFRGQVVGIWSTVTVPSDHETMPQQRLRSPAITTIPLLAFREIGRETVDYVAHILMYYVAYDRVVARDAQRAKALGP